MNDTSTPTDTTLAERFADLFSGNENAYGTCRGDGRGGEHGKVKCIYKTVREPWGLAQWQDHLTNYPSYLDQESSIGLGIIPIKQNNRCWFGAIDIDVYDLDLKALEQDVKALNLPLIPCRSKSGGAHLYVFCAEEIEARVLREKLAEWAEALGYASCEVFPKQGELDPEKDEVGSFINMPYFQKFTMRYAVHNGTGLRAEEFLDLAESMRVSRAEIEAITLPPAPIQKVRNEHPAAAAPPPIVDVESNEATAPVAAEDAAFRDGPPCLQHLAQQRVNADRNLFLFGAAVYAKRKYGDDWRDFVRRANEACCDPPLPDKELESTILKSGDKKDYHYKCHDAPCQQYCNTATCLQRRYGVRDTQSDSAADAFPTRLVLTGHEIITAPFPAREPLVEGVLTTQALGMIFGVRGVGKTHCALALARAVATGTPFMVKEWSVAQPRHVLYIDTELPGADLRRCASELFGSTFPDTFSVLPSELVRRELDTNLMLNNERHQRRLLALLADLYAQGLPCDLIIIDNYSTGSFGIDENSNSEQDPIMRFLLQLRHSGRTVVGVHHAGKSGEQRGASRREDHLDLSIKLSVPAVQDYSTVHFKLSFTKSRGKWPDPREVDCKLVLEANRPGAWTHEATKCAPKQWELVLQYKHDNPGAKQKEMAEHFNVSVPAINQHLSRAELQGYYVNGRVTNKGKELLFKRFYSDEEREF